MTLDSGKLSLYQKWLKKKFYSIELLYYNHVDELSQTIGDLEVPGLKPDDYDFTLNEYSFVRHWEDGLISSAKVHTIMEMMNLEDAARAKITKRLQNLMFKHDTLTEHIKPVITALDGECIELMVQYLTMMKRFFKKMKEIDETQVNLTWVQQFFKKNKSDELAVEQMTLNQTIRHIEAFIDGSAGQRFHLGDQIIVFDEEIGFDDRAIHWIFAPRTYIELLRVLFDVKENLGKDEIEYLKNLLKEVLE